MFAALSVNTANTEKLKQARILATTFSNVNLRRVKVAMKKILLVLGKVGIILPSYVGIIINHYKDPSNQPV